MADINGNLEINTSFFRVGSDYKILKNEEYELVSVDGKSIGLKFRREKDGRQNLNYQKMNDLPGNKAYDLVPEFLLDQIKSAKTADDIEELFGDDDFFDMWYVSSNGTQYVGFDMPLIAKQTKVEPGYKKHDIILGSYTWVGYHLDENDNIDGITIGVGTSFYSGYIYDEANHQFKSIEDLKIEYESFYEEENLACMNSNAGTIIAYGDGCTVSEPYGTGSYDIVPYFVGETGKVELKIDNEVNGAAKYNAAVDKELEYAITVKNTGNAGSGENVITSYVPKGLEVEVSTITDSGVYNSVLGAVYWNLDYIGPGETVELSYKATAPASLSGEELIGRSSVESGQVEGVVYSANTIVTMDKVVEVINNPDTGTMIYIANTNIGMSLSHLIMFAVALFAIVVFLIVKLKKTKRHE